MSLITRFITTLPIFLLAIVFHEYSHGWVADKLGDPTARDNGRLTLNPLIHLDPLGTLMFVISSLSGVGFGWAKPVPVNPRNFKNPKRDMMWVSLAGPGANFSLAILFSIIWRLLLSSGISIYSARPLFSFLLMCIYLNLLLGIFNLIPIPPLDGSRILTGILPMRQAIAFSRIEPYGFFILFALLLVGVIGGIIWPIVQFFTGILIG